MNKHAAEMENEVEAKGAVLGEYVPVEGGAEGEHAGVTHTAHGDEKPIDPEVLRAMGAL